MEWKLKYKIESESEVDKMNEDVKQKSESRSQMSKTINAWMRTQNYDMALARTLTDMWSLESRAWS